MALTPQQEAEVAFQKEMEGMRAEQASALEMARIAAQAEATAAQEAQRAANLAEQEAQRAANQAAEDAKRVKLEALRMAKEIVVENRRTQSAAEATDITADAIQTIADSLTAYVNS